MVHSNQKVVMFCLSAIIIGPTENMEDYLGKLASGWVYYAYTNVVVTSAYSLLYKSEVKANGEYLNCTNLVSDLVMASLLPMSCISSSRCHNRIFR